MARGFEGESEATRSSSWEVSRSGVAGLLIAAVLAVLQGCSTLPESRKDLGFPVELPFMRMEPQECYYLDDFLPTPDNMVVGRSGGLHLRYYTYNSAIYKFWKKEKVMLAFYSRDQRCWSLFEEYATSGFSL
jgi:hypothetical protein